MGLKRQRGKEGEKKKEMKKEKKKEKKKKVLCKSSDYFLPG